MAKILTFPNHKNTQRQNASSAAISPDEAKEFCKSLQTTAESLASMVASMSILHRELQGFVEESSLKRDSDTKGGISVQRQTP